MKVFKKVKSILGVFLILVMATTLFTACSDNSSENSSEKNKADIQKT